MKAAKTLKNLKEMSYPPQKKKSFQNEKEIVLHQKRQILPFHKLLQKT